MRIKILAGIYILLLTVVIYLASNKETGHLLHFIYVLPWGDKIGHLFLMGMLSFLVNLALNGRTVRLWRVNVPLGILITMIVVTLEEISQIFVRSRTFDFGDLLFDFIGVVIFGQLACWLVQRKTVKA